MEVRQSTQAEALRFIESVGHEHPWLTTLWDGQEARFCGTAMAPIVALEWFVIAAGHGQDYVRDELLMWEARREASWEGTHRLNLEAAVGGMVLRGIGCQSVVRKDTGGRQVQLIYVARHGTELARVWYRREDRYTVTHLAPAVERRWRGPKEAPQKLATLMPVWDAILNRTEENGGGVEI